MLALSIILILMILGAVVALEVPDILSSVVTSGAVGLGLCLAFLMLKAPDVAITQLVVEIVSLIIFIRATLGREAARVPRRSGIFPTAMGVGFGVIVLLVASTSFRDLPVFGAPQLRVAQHYIASGLQQTGATNLVASVMLDYRAFDTLGEATVLLTAALAILAVLRRVGRKPADNSEAESHD